KIGNYNYENFTKEFNIKVRSLGKTYFSKLNSDESNKFNLVDKILIKLFGRLLEFPDIELIFNTYKVLKNFNKFDLLITIGRPYPIHWGAALFKTFNNVGFTWIADCGDPYMGNPMIKHPFYFKYVEKWFCKKVDYLTIPIKEALPAYYKEFHPKIKIIPQGFNFEDTLSLQYKKNEITTFIYAGIFYKDVRDPRPFLDYLVKLNR